MLKNCKRSAAAVPMLAADLGMQLRASDFGYRRTCPIGHLPTS